MGADGEPDHAEEKVDQHEHHRDFEDPGVGALREVIEGNDDH